MYHSSGFHFPDFTCDCRRVLLPQRFDAPAPEGWWYPSGVKDCSLPCPTVLVPKRLLIWDRALVHPHKYGITNSSFWHADDDMTTFTQLKQDMQSFEEFFKGDFNSQRERTALQHRTVQSNSFTALEDINSFLHSYITRQAALEIIKDV